MKAEAIEANYRALVCGGNPIEYLFGRTLKEVSHRAGQKITETSEGHPILDGELYAVTATRIWLVE